MPHYAQYVKQTHGVPTVAFDYAFMGDRRSEEQKAMKSGDNGKETKEDTTIKILVGKDVDSKCVTAIPVPCKGIDVYDWAIKQILCFLNFLGYKKLIMRADQETSLAAVLETVRLFRGNDTQNMIENSPVHDSQSNGFIERGVQQVEGMIRTLKDALETRLSCKTLPDSPLLPWLVVHAGNIITLYQKGKGETDGRTPFHRLRRKPLQVDMCEYGEHIHFMIPDALKHGHLQPRWREVLFLGIRLHTSEKLVGAPEGVFKVRTLRRRPEGGKMGSRLRPNGEGGAMETLSAHRWREAAHQATRTRSQDSKRR